MDMPLFCPELVAERWIKDYIKDVFKSKDTNFNEDSFEVSIINTYKKK